jgi:N-formylmethionyl-tRNA deformylase
MAKNLKILIFPDPRLRKVAEKITKFDKSLENLANSMLKTMYDANGIGLAATQVDQHIRLIVMDLSENRDDPRIFINPTYKILENHSLYEFEEGCLSIPGFMR